ncbi:MAG TPA: A24 family peptidase [Candidatus Sulfotelmatobacter sp.]|nr:A24 family peptidase [Candidatus Sulfotelmatobacter sp.]
MTESNFIIGGALVALIGAISDVRSARIPNWLTYTAAISALVLRVMFLGFSGFKSGAIGMLIAGGLFLILFVLGAMGGGDMKLMAAVGIWVGGAQVGLLLVTAAMAGGVLALTAVVRQQALGETALNIAELLRHGLTAGPSAHPTLSVQAAGSRRVPFGVAIAVGTLFCVCNAVWWR